jgi:hypothetical protein
MYYISTYLVFNLVFFSSSVFFFRLRSFFSPKEKKGEEKKPEGQKTPKKGPETRKITGKNTPGARKQLKRQENDNNKHYFYCLDEELNHDMSSFSRPLYR